MKNKRGFIIIFGFLSLLSMGQGTDTISNNQKRPPVLDLLGSKGLNKTQAVNGNSTNSRRKAVNKSRKTVSNSAPKQKSILTRALARFVPNDQFNISVIKNEIFELTEFEQDNRSLPGVLVNNESNTKTTVELIEERFAVRLEIDTAGVQGDIDFFERLMYNTLDLDLAKDRVEVKIWNFPYAEINQKKKSSQKATPQGSPNVAQTEEIVQTEEKTSLFIEWWFWAIVVGLLALLITIILLVRRKPKNDLDEDLIIDNNAFKKMSLSAMDRAPISLKVNEFKKLLIESPGAVSSFMENLIETNQEDALTVFSFLAKPFPDLIGQLKPFMSYSAYLTLLNKIDEDIEEKIDPDTKDKFLLTFNNTVRAISNEENSIEKTPDHKVFGFLEQLNDIQVFKLIERDKPELASVLFAQLPDHRKLKIMELLDHVQRSEILLKLK